MNKFKKMKFWIEPNDKKLYDRVCNILKMLDYLEDMNIKSNVCAIQTDLNGVFSAATECKDEHWYNALYDHEEINIDWLRTPKPETLEFNGKQYDKKDVEKALALLIPLN